MKSPDPLKHRLNLWIKSETAMGVPSVRRIEFAQSASPALEESHPVAAAPRSVQPVAPLAPSRPATAASQKSQLPAERTMTASNNTSLALLETSFAGAILPRDEKIRLLNELDVSAVTNCTKCGLHATRTRTVFG